MSLIIISRHKETFQSLFAFSLHLTQCLQLDQLEVEELKMEERVLNHSLEIDLDSHYRLKKRALLT